MPWPRQVQFEAAAGAGLGAMSYPCPYARLAAPLRPLLRWVAEPLEQAWLRLYAKQ